MQRTKISALAVAAPPFVARRTQRECFRSFPFSGFFNTLVGVPSVTSRSQTCHAVFGAQQVEHDSSNMGQWLKGSSAALYGSCECFASLYFGFTECLSLIRLLYKNYQRLSGSNSRNVFLTVLEGGKSVIQQLWCLVRTYFLVRR